MTISYNEHLSEDFIREYKDQLYWIGISMSQTLSEKFIKNNLSIIKIDFLLQNKKTSQEVKDYAVELIGRYKDLL